MPALSRRGRALRWMTAHRNLTEQPPGSNRDKRKDGITAAQKRLGDWLVGEPWCGVWVANAALAGGVKMSAPYRWASVAAIEADAKAKRNGFRGWVDGGSRAVPRSVLRGDLVVLYGYGVHVEMVRLVIRAPGSKRLGWILTDGGNTSPEGGEDATVRAQAEGGGSFRRWRRVSDVRGYALVRYGS